jgi:hypothetical protein
VLAWRSWWWLCVSKGRAEALAQRVSKGQAIRHPAPGWHSWRSLALTAHGALAVAHGHVGVGRLLQAALAAQAARQAVERGRVLGRVARGAHVGRALGKAGGRHCGWRDTGWSDTHQERRARATPAVCRPEADASRCCCHPRPCLPACPPPSPQSICERAPVVRVTRLGPQLVMEPRLALGLSLWSPPGQKLPARQRSQRVALGAGSYVPLAHTAWRGDGGGGGGHDGWSCVGWVGAHLHHTRERTSAHSPHCTMLSCPLASTTGW